MNLRLPDLNVLILDLQSTGASPAHGHILEIACAVTTAAQASDLTLADISSHVVKLPRGETLPRRISQITGITDDDLKTATPAKKVWQNLASTAQPSPFPTVVHYARFEKNFLTHLHETHAPKTTFPLDFICTHEIARRLLPAVPRKGLKAITGFLGIPVPDLKRAAAHVLATARLWSELVPRLAEDHDVETLEALRTFLETVKPQKTRDWKFPLPRSRRLNLPDRPGIYRFLSKRGNILYVGKAASLKKRVSSYYTKKKGAEESKLELVSRAWDVMVTPTPSPLEAALLENDEIKKYAPPYNRALKSPDPFVWFATPNADSIQSSPDPRHTLGPVPRKETLSALHHLALLLDPALTRISEDHTEAFGLATGLPERFIPNPETVVEALSFFEEEFPKAWDPPTLLKLGHDLYKELVIEADEEDEEDIEQDEEDIEQDEEELPSKRTGFDPEDLFRFMQGIVINAAHALRRSAFLTHLAESTILWTPKGRKVQRRLITIHRGRVQSADYHSARKPIPPPPGWNIPNDERRTWFDRATYDRMRVLTTEIRRVLSDKGKVDIRLTPKILLTPKTLADRLRWV